MATAFENKPNLKAVANELSHGELINHILEVERGINYSDVYVVPDGMPLKVFNDKYAKRRKTLADGTETQHFQTWQERIREVVMGNFSLDKSKRWTDNELRTALKLGTAGHMPFSGRHLQHGDLEQTSKHLELFSNCSTAAFTFMLFKLLLDGSGVGRDYSTATCRTNWDNMPNIRLVLSQNHPDFGGCYNEFQGYFETHEAAKAKYPSESETVRWFKVEDSREGWTQVVATLETAAYHEKHRDKLFIFVFDDIRGAGQPIKGQQNRPASGPLPLMRALAQVASIKGAGMAPWLQSLYIDHYLAACVALGGVRRAARMATKFWKDKDVFEFIEIKRDGSLWTSNNSILVDKEFWDNIGNPRHHAYRVFHAATGAAFLDKTGEPGFINYDKLCTNDEGEDKITASNYLNLGYNKLQLHPRTIEMCGKILEVLKTIPYKAIVNPCGEIPISPRGGYCLISDANAARTNKQELRNVIELTAHALVRANLMESMYDAEVKRTNRIGIGLIGIHEFAWREFGCNFYDLISIYDYIIEAGAKAVHTYSMNSVLNLFDQNLHERFVKACKFWSYIDNLRIHAEESAADYSRRLNVTIPHTVTTLKPSGTTSKPLQTTEAANLPAFTTYMRWVQYENETQPGVPNQALEELRAHGYPVEDVNHKYPGKSVVGFPTKQPIVDVMGPENIVTANDVSVEDHYKWLELLEMFWLGHNEDGSSRNGQISYTLKYRMSSMSFEQFRDTIAKYQSRIRCCAFMDQEEIVDMKEKYGYVPESPLSFEEYTEYNIFIERMKEEAYDSDLLSCSGGICPVEVDL